MFLLGDGVGVQAALVVIVVVAEELALRISRDYSGRIQRIDNHVGQGLLLRYEHGHIVCRD